MDEGDSRSGREKNNRKERLRFGEREPARERERKKNEGLRERGREIQRECVHCIAAHQLMRIHTQCKQRPN